MRSGGQPVPEVEHSSGSGIPKADRARVFAPLYVN